MATRYCAGCGSEVEDVGGFCLLGHSLRLVPAPLEDIQAEIATAFDAATGRMEAAFRLAGLPREDHAQAMVDLPPEPPQAPIVEAPPVPPGPPSEPPRRRVEWGPPPPPEMPAMSQEEKTGRWEHVWGAASPEDVLRDPITAFSPAPSMDWGPERTEGKRRLRPRRPGQKTA